MKKCIIFCIFVSLLVQSCTPRFYTSLPRMLNKCKGYAVVIGTAHNHENPRKVEHHTLVVSDSTGKYYQFKGGDYGYSLGDILTIK